MVTKNNWIGVTIYLFTCLFINLFASKSYVVTIKNQKYCKDKSYMLSSSSLASSIFIFSIISSIVYGVLEKNYFILGIDRVNFFPQSCLITVSWRIMHAFSAVILLFLFLFIFPLMYSFCKTISITIFRSNMIFPGYCDQSEWNVYGGHRSVSNSIICSVLFCVIPVCCSAAK